MISESKITEISCSIDDFCKDFVPAWQKTMLQNGESVPESLNFLSPK